MHQPSTPRQLIKCLYGLEGSSADYPRLIWNDSALMDMDAPQVIPAGSTQRLYPHDELHAHVTRETRCYRDPLPNGRHF